MLKNSSASREWSGLVLRVSNYLLSFIMGFFYFPVASMFGSFLSCQTRDSVTGILSTEATCWSGANITYPVFALIGFTSLTLIVVMYNFYMLECISYDTVSLSMAHGRISALESSVYMVVMFLTTALSGVMKEQPNVRWFMNILSLCASVLVTYLYMFYQVGYRLCVDLE